MIFKMVGTFYFLFFIFYFLGVLGRGIIGMALDAGMTVAELESFVKSLGSIHGGSGMTGDASLFWVCLVGSAQG